MCRPRRSSRVGGPHALDRGRRVGERRSRTSSRPGRWRCCRACRRATPGVTRISTRWRRRAGERRSRRVELVGVVDRRSCPTPASSASRSSRSDFALPCRYDPRGLEAGAQRDRAARRRTRRRSRSPPRRARAGPRCTGTPSTRRRARTSRRRGGERLAERAGAGAEVVLGDDVRGRAELARELDEVAAADLDVAGAFRVVPSGHTWERLWAVAIARRGCHVGVGGLAASRE